MQQTGAADHTPVCPREIAEHVLELSATAIVLEHKCHAGANLTPNDIGCKPNRSPIDFESRSGNFTKKVKAVSLASVPCAQFFR